MQTPNIDMKIHRERETYRRLTSIQTYIIKLHSYTHLSFDTCMKIKSHIDICTKIDTQKQKPAKTHIQSNTHMYTLMDKYTQKDIHRQKDPHRDIDRIMLISQDKFTERQTDTHTYTHSERETDIYTCACNTQHTDRLK